MKKLILATAIASLTTFNTASAATVYEKNDLKIDISGGLLFQVFKEVGANKDLGMDHDFLSLSIGVNYNLSNNISAFGKVDLDRSEALGDGTDDDTIDEAYVGLKIGSFSASVGPQNFGGIGFGAFKAYELTSFNALEKVNGNDVIKLKYDNGRVAATLSHDLEDEDKESTTDLFVKSTFGKFNVGLVYQDYRETPTSAPIEIYGASLALDVGRFSVGVDYSTKDEFDMANASVGFPLSSKAKAAVGVTLEKPAAGDDVLDWYANATYNLHKNVFVFAEIGDNDEMNTDVGYLAGMKISF